MKRHILFGLSFNIFLLAALFAPANVNADVILGEFRTEGWTYGWRNMEFDILNVEFGLISSATEVDWYITINDIGQTFAASSGYPGFEEMRALLSNGIDDWLVIFEKGPDDSGGGENFYESQMENYFGTVPDFTGSDITSISLTVNDLFWEYPVSIPGDPELGEIWNYVEYDLTVSIEGIPIPEPATVLLLGLGGLALLKKRKT